MEAAVAAEFDDIEDGSADEGELLALMLAHLNGKEVSVSQHAQSKAAISLLTMVQMLAL